MTETYPTHPLFVYWDAPKPSQNLSIVVFCLFLNLNMTQTSPQGHFRPSNLVARTQLIDSQDLSSTERLSKQVNCPHLSAENTVGIRRL